MHLQFAYKTNSVTNQNITITDKQQTRHHCLTHLQIKCTKN